jgi:hypothetical protein
MEIRYVGSSVSVVTAPCPGRSDRDFCLFESFQTDDDSNSYICLCGLSWFSAVLADKCQNNTSNLKKPRILHNFGFHFSLPIFIFDAF